MISRNGYFHLDGYEDMVDQIGDHFNELIEELNNLKKEFKDYYND